MSRPRQILRNGVTAETLAKDLADRMFPDCARYLYGNIDNLSPHRLTLEEAFPEFVQIFREVFTEPGHRKALIKLHGMEIPNHGELVRMLFKEESMLHYPVWVNMQNSICDFMIAHTVSGEHIEIPERGAIMLRECLEVLKAAVNPDLDKSPVPPRSLTRVRG